MQTGLFVEEMFTTVCLTGFYWLFSLSRGERLSQRWGGVVPVNVQLWWDVKGAQRGSFRPGLECTEASHALQRIYYKQK